MDSKGPKEPCIVGEGNGHFYDFCPLCSIRNITRNPKLFGIGGSSEAMRPFAISTAATCLAPFAVITFAIIVLCPKNVHLDVFGDTG